MKYNTVTVKRILEGLSKNVILTVRAIKAVLFIFKSSDIGTTVNVRDSRSMMWIASKIIGSGLDTPLYKVWLLP